MTIQDEYAFDINQYFICCHCILLYFEFMHLHMLSLRNADVRPSILNLQILKEQASHLVHDQRAGIGDKALEYDRAKRIFSALLIPDRRNRCDTWRIEKTEYQEREG